jgi:hypothetical protein
MNRSKKSFINSFQFRLCFVDGEVVETLVVVTVVVAVVEFTDKRLPRRIISCRWE